MLTGKRVLLVDDTKTVLMFTKMIFADTRAELATAGNGVEALKSAASFCPHLILMDIKMPEMDGIEACRLLKADPATREIPILMVTTKGEEEMIEKAFAAGCNGYLTKPINKMDLISKIKSLNIG